MIPVLAKSTAAARNMLRFNISALRDFEKKIPCAYAWDHSGSGEEVFSISVLTEAE
jgi:hypothetical protein